MVFLAASLVALVIRMRSSANIKWLKLGVRVWLKLGIKLMDKARFKMVERLHKTKRKRRGESGSPCLNPLVLLNQ